MEYIVMAAVLVVAIIIVAIVVKKKIADSSLKLNDDLAATVVDRQELTIRLETLPAEYIPDDSKLVAVTDRKVLARVAGLIPELAQVGSSVQRTAKTIQKSGEVLYKAVIPKGAKLAKSKSMNGAVRGFYHGKKGIAGHANWVEQQATTGTEVASGAISSAMNIASMIVGQYYMTQINSELEVIRDEIGAISSFQNDEFKGRVESLIDHIKEIANFQDEIINNIELRYSKILQLDVLTSKCSELLAHANSALDGLADDNDLNFEKYEKELKVAQRWYVYQKILMEVLRRIAELRYTLWLGNVSRDQCNAMLDTYAGKVKKTQDRLISWHEKTLERLKIDTAETRRKRDGLDGVVHFLPGLFNDRYNFKDISGETAEMIRMQLKGHADLHVQPTSELYSEDVQLIIKNGEVYYLPGEN